MRLRLALALLLSLTAGARLARASVFATSVYDYSPGALTESPFGSGNLFGDPANALGMLDLLATRLAPSGNVVQLGQGGSITLGFDQPINNKPVGHSDGNPLGVDFVVFGNAFEQGLIGSGLFYREPGFVEVAKKKLDGSPDTFYLLLPYKLPSQLVGNTDSGSGTTLLELYADVHPVDGSGDYLLSPELSGSAGGDAFHLERAVLQSAPGVPLRDGNNQPQFIALDSIDFVRITDAIVDDAMITGGITADIDAVVNLPMPEPALAPLLLLGALALRGRRKEPSR